MYGDQDGARDDRPAAPVGVRIVVVILLVCGLALAALPFTVLLSGGTEAGRIALENASGRELRAVRVVHLAGEQERLIGSAHVLEPGGLTGVTFDRGDALSLRIEFADDTGHHDVPVTVPAGDASDAATRLVIDARRGVRVTHAATERASESSSAPPGGARDQGVETATAGGPYDLPEGWPEKWRPWFRHVDWVIGAEAGMARARETGKPMMMFYTATW